MGKCRLWPAGVSWQWSVTARLLITAYALSTSGSVLVSAGNTTTDAAALQQFAVQTNYTIWLSDPGNPCTLGWEGVTCNSQQRVTQVELVNYGNTGNFPDYLDQLDALEILQLSNGQLLGSLPSSWSSSFPSLQQLDLSHNNISGSVPDAWVQSGSFPMLTTLNLDGTFDKNTTRALPFQPGQEGMANLTSLNLALCNITGSLTSAWGAGFTNLSVLTLSSNQLSGSLPSGWGLLSSTSNLTDLELDGNQLTGSLASSWGSAGSFSQLQRLNLANNNLTGTLPAAWGEQGSLPQLQLLLLNNNNFTGQLPSSWADPNALVQLQTIYLQVNSLTGGIPVSWANNRSSMLKYLRPGNQGMCEPVRARLGGVRTFGSTSPALYCLDGGCQDSDIASALALPDLQACSVTIAADGTITSTGCLSGAIQQNGTANSLAGQFVIANQSSLTLTSSVFSQLQSALVKGPTGAYVNQSAPLVISNSTVHIVDSTFSSNQRFDFGGIVIMSGSAVTLSNCTFESLTGRVGGAVMIMNGSLVMMDQGTAFSSNAGSCLAGAVLVNSDSALYMEGVAFNGNQALGDRGGGAVLLYGNSTLHATSSTFTDNAATAANLYAVDAAAMAAGTRPSDDAIPSLWCGAVGGVPGIDSLYGINDLASNHLLGGYSGTTPDPTLGQGGGAIYAASFNVLNITSSTFSQNTASRVNITDFKQGRGAGGAISINSDTLITSSCSAGIVSITGCTFKGNTANSGGAVQLVGAGHAVTCHTSGSNVDYGKYTAAYLDSLPYASYSFCGLTTAFCVISNSSFEGNSALLGGGGLSVLQGYSVQLDSVTFQDSTTPLYGGAIAVANGSAVISSGCTFTDCSASEGGAIYATASTEAYITATVIPQWRDAYIYASDVYKLGRQMGSLVNVADSSFKGNVASTAGGAVAMSGDSQLVSQGNTFTGSQAGTQGGALYLSNTCEQLSVNDVFSSNSAQQGGAVAILNPALDSGRYILSVVTASGTSSILRLPCGVASALANATFTGNQAELSGGAVYVVSTPSGECRTLLEGSLLEGNYAVNGGAFFAGSNPCFMVNGTDFIGNSGTSGGALAMQSTTNATFTGVTAVDNTADCGGGMFVDRAALIQVMSSNMSNNQATNGAGFAIQQVTSMSMNNVSIVSNTASGLGGAMYSIQPSISIQDRAALNVADDVFTIGDLFLHTVNMSLNTADQGGCMYVTGNGANVTAVSSYFDSCIASDVGGGLMCEECPQVYMSQVIFSSNQAQASAGGFRCEGCLAVILEQVQFLNNSAIHGGGLDINATLPNPVIIVSSQFISNSARIVTDDDGDSNLTTTLAGNGGGIRNLGGNLYLIDDSFDDNIATNGAAVYAVQGCGEDDSYTSGYCSLVDSTASVTTTAVAAAPEEPTIAVDAALRYAYILDTTPNCSAIRLAQTEFYGNKAVGGGGGAIFWDGPVDDLVVSCSDDADVFDVDSTTNSSTLPSTCPDWEGNNSTSGFGEDLASEAAAINASESEQTPITGIASGDVLPSLQFDVIDHFGNIVSGGVSAASMLISATSTNAILGGQQLAQAVDGVVTFDGLLITANATMNTTSIYGLNYTITFAAASVSGITSWDVAVNIRGCEPGEQYDDNVCRECQEQTYSFHPGDDGGQCQTCPDTAHCPGGPIFVPDDYYWHSAFDSDTAQRCPNTFACSLSTDTSSVVATTSDTVRSDLLEACQTAWYNGSTSSTPELNPDGSFEDIMCVTSAGNVSYQNAQCQDGYNGLLCTNCDNGWGNSRTFHCNQCMSSVPTNTFLIFLGHLASFCYVAWLVRGSLASAAQVGRAEADHFEQFSDMMKVLTTNLQTNGIIAGLNINWPNSLRSIQNIFNVVQSSMVNTVSMDCSLQYWDSPIMAQAQIEAVIAMLVPIGMLGIFLLMWTCRWAYLRKYGQLTDITGQPISRASSASSARSSHAFHERPKQLERSLTGHSDLSDSGSSSDSEAAGQGEEASREAAGFIAAGQSMSEMGSPRPTNDDVMASTAAGQTLEQGLSSHLGSVPAGGSQPGSPPHAFLGSFGRKSASRLQHVDSRQAKKRASWRSLSRSKSSDKLQDGQEQSFIGAGQSKSEDGSPRTTLEDVDEADEADAGQEAQRLAGSNDRFAPPAYVPPAETAPEDRWRAGSKHNSLQRQLAATAAHDGLQSESSGEVGPARSLDSVDSNSPLLARLMESTSLTRSQLVEELGDSLTAATLAVHTDQMASLEGASEPYEEAAQSLPVHPVLADIHTSSSHPLQPEPLSAAGQMALQRRDRKPGSTRFALDVSDMGSGKASTVGSTKSRLGQSALKRGNTMSPAGNSKGQKRVMLAAPDDSLAPAMVSLEIQDAVTAGSDEQVWPHSHDRAQGSRLMPSKSSLKSPGSSKRRSGLSSTKFPSLRFSLEPHHHVIAVESQDSMSSDHSTLSASFKSFRTIPSRLSQFGSQHSLRWTLATDQSVEFWAYCKRRFITTAVVLAYFMYPDLSENIANIFSCYPVQFGTYSDGYTGSHTVYYWTQDTTEVCFSNNHFWTALLLGIPGVLIVCLGIPAWFAGVLYRGRHDLDNLSLHRTYGFLYQGYKHKYYWWESSLLLRNLLLVAVVYLGPALGVYIQAHIVLLIMIVSLVLHAYARPFKERIIDNMEFVSIGSITLVMYLSLYFLDVDQGLSSRTQWVLGFILLALIAGTCLWFLFNIFRRKEVLVALLKSTTVTASRGLAQIRTMVKSDRLRSMITRSTDRSTSNVTLTSNTTMTTNAEE